MASVNVSRDNYVAGLVHDLRQPMQVLNVRLPAIETAVQDLPAGTHAKEAMAAFRQVALLQDALLRHLGYEASSDISLNAAHRQFSLLSVLEPAIAIVENARAIAGMQIELPSKDLNLHTSPSTLHRIVSNLVLNAVQHSHGTSVRVHANADSVNLILRVEDNGRGLPGTRVHSAEAFLRYSAIRASESAGQSGTGLTAAMELAESLGGKLELESSSKQGTVWKLTIPDAVAYENKEPHAGFSADELSGQVIAILDDSKIGAESLGEKFASLGATVISAYDEMELLRRVHRAFPMPVLYVLDFLLGNGVTLNRSLDTLAHVTGALQSSVILTAHPMHHALRDAQKRVAGVVPRPLQDAHFRALVDFASGRIRPLHLALSKAPSSASSKAIAP